jgi:hypothetical protein
MNLFYPSGLTLNVLSWSWSFELIFESVFAGGFLFSCSLFYLTRILYVVRVLRYVYSLEEEDEKTYDKLYISGSGGTWRRRKK